MAKEHILVVEDEEDILELVRYNLMKEGYRVKGVMSGELAVESAKQEKPDLVVLDLMLPGMDGFEVCKTLKNNPATQNIPVLILSAKGEDTDIVAGLELDADDYVTKPFSPRVLIARVRSVLRRNTQKPVSQTDVIRISDLTIHPGRHEVTVGKEKVTLTATEFRILHLLARRPGWVFSREQIVDNVHGEDYPVTDRSVDVQIVGLRRKLGESGTLIETVRGLGYRFRE